MTAMKSRIIALSLVAVTCASPSMGEQAPSTSTLTVPTFGTVTIYRPAKAPDQVVLFLSGDGGWNLGVVPMAEMLRREGALVVGIDIRTFIKNLDAGPSCVSPAGPLEELSRAVQQYAELPFYHRPIIVGYSSGATMAYAALAGAPPETFAGGISLGFCPDLEMKTAPCRMRGLRPSKRPTGTGYDLAPYSELTVPWAVLHGDADQVCPLAGAKAFVGATGSARLFALPKVGHGFGVPANWQQQYLQAYRVIANAKPIVSATTSAPDVADLRLVEVPATGKAAGDTMAIVLTGDGGWADLDKGVAQGLATHGIPVVGWSSLTYYWTARTPDQAAADLARIVERYSAIWQRTRVLLVGYSFGADVAPYLVNRLPDPTRAKISRVAMLGPSASATFEFHLSAWLGKSAGERPYPTGPEIDRIDLPMLCVAATDEADSICRSSRNPRLRLALVGIGHHFSGDYAQLVDLILR